MLLVMILIRTNHHFLRVGCHIVAISYPIFFILIKWSTTLLHFQEKKKVKWHIFPWVLTLVACLAALIDQHASLVRPPTSPSPHSRAWLRRFPLHDCLPPHNRFVVHRCIKIHRVVTANSPLKIDSSGGSTNTSEDLSTMLKNHTHGEHKEDGDRGGGC
jgi:hypothetical protein